MNLSEDLLLHSWNFFTNIIIVHTASINILTAVMKNCGIIVFVIKKEIIVKESYLKTTKRVQVASYIT